MASHAIENTGNSLFTQLAQGWTNLREQRAARRAARVTRNRIARELATYTDRELFDLGIARANIPEILDGTFRRG